MNIEKEMPTDASIITTYRCLMKCKMCNIWKHPSDAKREIKPQELEILPQLKFINVTGGEPFLRGDLDEIVEVCFRKAPRVVISTSGYHVNAVQKLAEKFPKIGIRVSIEGLSTINDYLRGRDSGFDRGLKTLLGLRRMGIRDIGFGITVSNNNSADMLELYELAKNLKMEFATAAFHNSYYFHKEDNRITNQEEVIGNFYELIERLLKENNPKSWFRAFFNLGLINYIKGNRRLLPCEAGTVNFFIDPYGEVYPCNGLEDRYWKESMGNIRNCAKFEDLWFSARAAKVRGLVRTCPKNCWMVGTAAPVMKKYIRHPLRWVIKHKAMSLLGRKIDRTCLPQPFDVGQDVLQGDLRNSERIAGAIDEDFSGAVTNRFITRVISNRRLAGDIFVLEVEKHDFQYEAGQTVSIGPHLKYHLNRDYSFYSSPREDTLKFLIREVKGGDITPVLSRMKPGDKVDLVGPYGDFHPRRVNDPGSKHLFIASGVGISPFRSFVKTYPDLDYTLIHGIRFAEEEVMGEDFEKGRYISCVSKGGGGAFKGKVTDYLKGLEVAQGTFCYICGNQFMVRDVYRLLVEKGIPEENILTEQFYA